ncbi:hypothetical protein EVAR_62087_1 [Eumeta japonica]|uniref:Uncharacterized protein n=1 Tax=Eumeta variegata TaxID=151549 RepID=A0A4C1Z241_EUMVA|nr:hypothetical protein EVAR_62087_1 [Eumeta japonica]
MQAAGRRRCSAINIQKYDRRPMAPAILNYILLSHWTSNVGYKLSQYISITYDPEPHITDDGPRPSVSHQLPSGPASHFSLQHHS